MKTLNYINVADIINALEERRDWFIKMADLLKEDAHLKEFWTKRAGEVNDLADYFDSVKERLLTTDTSVRITCKF